MSLLLNETFFIERSRCHMFPRLQWFLLCKQFPLTKRSYGRGGGYYKEKPMYSPSQNVLFLSTYKHGVIGFGPYGYGDISWQRTFHDRGDVLWHGTFHNEGRFVRGFFTRGRCVRERLAICAVCTSGSSIRGRFVCATLFLAFLLQERSTLFIKN